MTQNPNPATSPDVSVVIPVCNEEENVLPLAREIHAALAGKYSFEQLFVDDGSTDRTAAVVLEARAQGMPEVSYKGLRLATDVRLASAHTWARDVWREATIGVDDLAQSTLGPVARVELPRPGQRVARGAPLFRLFHDGRELVARSPVDGEVTAINTRLVDEPGLVNQSPYGAGWAVRLRDSRLRKERRDLLGGTEARDWFRCEVDRLIAELSPATVPATMPDGGLVSAELYRFIQPDQWKRLNESFFDADEVSK